MVEQRLDKPLVASSNLARRTTNHQYAAKTKVTIMFGLGKILGDVIDTAANVATIVTEPVRIITKPVADLTGELAKEVKTSVKDVVGDYDKK